MQNLEKLRAYLLHFETSPDFGDTEIVAVIRRHLLVRIREAESAMLPPERFGQQVQAKNAVSSERLQLCAEAA